MVKMPHWPVPLWHKPIDLGLPRMLGLLAEVGNPQEKFPPVIHLAGTNGKGSTLAFLRAFLEAGGYSTHAYTSPHLVRFNERIRVRGREISDEMLYEVLEECRIAAEKTGLPITFFEGTTAAAFVAFARYPADVVLLETGLGGRLDATNVIEHPAATVITPISLDHMEFLGSTLPAIAGEKAGIMKPGSPCIIGYQEELVEEVLLSHAERLGCPSFAYGYDWGVHKTAEGMRFESEGVNWDLPMPALPGEHQIMNAGAAIATALKLPQFSLGYEEIKAGLTKAEWPARLQHITEGLLVDTLPGSGASEWELWVDGAHNEAGGYILSLFAETHQDKPLYLISGMTRGRDSEKFFSHLAPYARYIAGVLVEAEPSSHSPAYIVESAHKVGVESDAFDSVEEAISGITTRFGEKPGRILVCGSLYLAGMVLEKNHTVIG